MLVTALEEQQDNRDTGAFVVERIYCPSVLKLISSSLLGGGKYQDIYSLIADDDDESDKDNNDNDDNDDNGGASPISIHRGKEAEKRQEHSNSTICGPDD